MDVEWDIIARLAVAAALGAAIGLEREIADQPAGLRTHIAVALGAALFGVISTTGFREFETTEGTTNVQVDVTRVASLVASGIGFIGAGLIFRQGTFVRNLTTAASVWVVAAIGLSCGVGDFSPAVATTVIVLAALILLRIPRTWIRYYLRPNREHLHIVLRPGEPEAPVVGALADVEHVRVEDYTIAKDRGAYVLAVTVNASHGHNVRELIGPLAHLDAIETLNYGVPPTD